MSKRENSRRFNGPNTFDGYKKFIEGEAFKKGGDGYYYSHDHKLATDVHVRIEAFVRDGLDVVYVRYLDRIVLEYWEDETVVLRTGGYMNDEMMVLFNRYGPQHWTVWQEEDTGTWVIGKDGRSFRIPLALVDDMPIPFATWEKGKSGLEI